MLGKGEYDGPPTLQGEQLPLVMLPTSAGAGAFGNERCLVWHPEDEILVAMAESTGERQAVSVSSCRSCSHYYFWDVWVVAVFKTSIGASDDYGPHLSSSLGGSQIDRHRRIVVLSSKWYEVVHDTKL